MSMGFVALALLLSAVLLVVVTEWPRFHERLDLSTLGAYRHEKRRSQFRVITGSGGRDGAETALGLPTEPLKPEDDFAASVQRDLENLPVMDPHDDRP